MARKIKSSAVGGRVVPYASPRLRLQAVWLDCGSTVARTVKKSCKARPKQSKPAPRFPAEAGTRTSTTEPLVFVESGLSATRMLALSVMRSVEAPVFEVTTVVGVKMFEDGGLSRFYARRRVLNVPAMRRSSFDLLE